MRDTPRPSNRLNGPSGSAPDGASLGRRRGILRLPDSVLSVIHRLERDPETDCSFRVELDNTVRALPGTRLEGPIAIALHELIREMRSYWPTGLPRSDRSIVVCARTDHGTVHIHVMGDAPGSDEESEADVPPETAGLAQCRSMVQDLGGRCTVRAVPFGRGVMVSMLIPEGHLMSTDESAEEQPWDG